MKIISYLIEVFGWLKIVLSPTLIAALVAGIIVYNKQDQTGFVIGGFIIFIGFIIGVLWANNIWRKHGTTNYLARISANPEFNKEK